MERGTRRCFPEKIKREVREKQNRMCAYCGSVTHLTIHHIIPKSQPDIAKKHGIDNVHHKCNSVGLCRECHDYFDKEAFKGRYFHQIMMEEGRPYRLG